MYIIKIGNFFVSQVYEYEIEGEEIEDLEIVLKNSDVAKVYKNFEEAEEVANKIGADVIDLKK